MNTRFLLCAAATALIAGCSAGPDDLDQWMQAQDRDIKGQVEPIPTLPQAQSAEFTAYGLPSPFDAARLKLAGRNAANAPDLNRPRDALENYDLERLKMIGSLQIKGVRHALIQAPDGVVYTVRAGSFIGSNFGRVTDITPDALRLSETVEDANGEWVRRDTELLLTQEQGQGQTK